MRGGGGGGGGHCFCDSLDVFSFIETGGHLLVESHGTDLCFEECGVGGCALLSVCVWGGGGGGGGGAGMTGVCVFWGRSQCSECVKILMCFLLLLLCVCVYICCCFYRSVCVLGEEERYFYMCVLVGLFCLLPFHSFKR